MMERKGEQGGGDGRGVLEIYGHLKTEMSTFFIVAGNVNNIQGGPKKN